jgi:hypothetical protein
LANLVFCQLLKNMPSKKSSSPTICHNSLVKLRSNLHQESWKKYNYVCALPPLENLHQKSFFILYFFFHSPTYWEMTMATTIRARIYAHEEVSFAKLLFCQVGLPNYWRQIFLVLTTLDGCQVDLPNCWSCSNHYNVGQCWKATSYH